MFGCMYEKQWNVAVFVDLRDSREKEREFYKYDFSNIINNDNNNNVIVQFIMYNMM